MLFTPKSGTQEMTTTNIHASDLANAAKRINQLHATAVAHATEAIGRAREAGEELISVKERLPHGELNSWIATNCDFAIRTAQRYMSVARGMSALGANAPRAAHLSLREAERMLSSGYFLGDLTLHPAAELVWPELDEFRRRVIRAEVTSELVRSGGQYAIGPDHILGGRITTPHVWLRYQTAIELDADVLVDWMPDYDADRQTDEGEPNAETWVWIEAMKVARERLSDDDYRQRLAIAVEHLDSEQAELAKTVIDNVKRSLVCAA